MLYSFDFNSLHRYLSSFSRRCPLNAKTRRASLEERVKKYIGG